MTPPALRAQRGLDTGSPWRDLWLLGTRYRALTIELVRREFTDRYTGQVLGTVWTLLHPLMLLLVYVFIFGYVFRIRMGGTRDLPYDYTTYLLAGVIPWLGFQEALMKSSTVILGNANLVKQVVFPIEILPVKTVLSALTSQIILLSLLIVYVLATYHVLPWTYALVPVLILIQAAMMMGVCYFVATASVFFRDTKDFIQIFNLIGVYLMPALYLPESVPRVFRPLLYMNPFSYLIWCYQDVLYFGRIQHGRAWLVLIVLSLLALYQGSRLFRSSKHVFGNLL